jgi:hypothetical protein
LAPVEQTGHAAVGPLQPQQDGYGSGLPGAVGAQESEQFARAHVQIEAVEGAYFSEALGYPSQFG